MGGSGQYYADCEPTTARVGAALGLAWCSGGLGAIARRSKLGKRSRRLAGNDAVVDPRSGNANPLACLVRGSGTLGETTCRSLFVLLVILAGYVGLARLVAGVPPSGVLLAQTIDRALGIVAFALDGLP
jgi:hypothetical protein